MDFVGRVVDAISGALGNPEKVPEALILCGVLEAGAALSLIFFSVLGGVFLDRDALAYVYYGAFIAVVVFAVVEASLAFCIAHDPNDWHGVGMVMLWLSVLPTIIVATFDGFCFVAPAK